MIIQLDGKIPQNLKYNLYCLKFLRPQVWRLGEFKNRKCKVFYLTHPNTEITFEKNCQ
jgi:hypothetical protein